MTRVMFLPDLLPPANRPLADTLVCLPIWGVGGTPKFSHMGFEISGGPYD